METIVRASTRPPRGWCAAAASVLDRLRALWATPLGKLLAAALVLRLVGLTWGLPGADGWDDDGIAPRDFLPGVLQTYWPGKHYVYPPLHLLLLTIVSAPIWIAGLLRAPAFSPDAVVATFINVPTMTALAILARLVSALLSLGLVWNLAKIGEDLRGSARAGAWVAVACVVNATFTYYSQTTNLDGPYLFWGVWSLRWLVHAIVHRKPSSVRRSLILAALAVATKDQAYALFILGMPASIAAWFALDPRARPLVSAVAKEVAIGTAIAAALLLFIDGAITNPMGFRDRVGFLLGTGSQDHAYYAKTWEGRYYLLRDVGKQFDQFYPYFFAPIVALGLGVAVRAHGSGEGPGQGVGDGPRERRPDGSRRAAALVPLLAAVSFTIAFDMTARRSEHRFVLPQALMFAVYIGIAFDAFHGWVAGKVKDPARAKWVLAVAVAPALGAALFGAVAVDVAMLLDPRYDTEGWLRANLRAGDRLEVYDNNVHLPRLPADAVIDRVDVTPVASRNPILGVHEVSERFSNVEARRPRFIVVSEFWAGKYLVDPAQLAAIGRVPSPTQAAFDQDVDSRTYFRDLHDGRLNYRTAHVSAWTSTIWPRLWIHASLAREMWIYERTAE